MRLLSAPSRPLGLAELSGESGLPKGTLFGILRTLQLLGLVEKDPESRKYQLGAGLLRLGMSYLDASELRRLALRWSDVLATRSNETVQLGILYDRHVLVLHHIFRRTDGRQAFPTGAVLPLHATAMGKVLLAASRDAGAELGTLELTPFTPRTITDPDRLASGLAEVRERGWAASIEEFVEGVASLAAPITDHRGETVGALSLSAPVSRLCRAQEPRGGLVLSVRDFAGAVSRDLGARPWELALQSQLQPELGPRLKAELERHQQAAHEIHEELQQRRAMRDGMWSVEHPHGLTTDTTRSEMELTIRRQGAELAATERQLAELRERLRESERAPTQAKVTAGAVVMAAPAAVDTGGTLADRAAAVVGVPSPVSRVEETLQAGGLTSATGTAPPSTSVTSPGLGAVTLGSPEIRLFAEEFAAQLLQRWQGALQQQFRGELGQCLEAPVERRAPERERPLQEEASLIVRRGIREEASPVPACVGTAGHS